MSVLTLPWLELAIAIGLVGAVVGSRLRDPLLAFRWGLVFTGAVFATTVLAWLAFSAGVPAGQVAAHSVQPLLFGRSLFALDVVAAPLVPALALLHFLTAVATARTKMRKFSTTWSLTTEAIQVALFSCRDPWLVIALLAAGTVPPVIELINRRQPTRIYIIHMALFIGLLVVGWAFVCGVGPDQPAPASATALLLAAILVRCGTVPAHCWITDWFENASFGNALLFTTPLTGVFAAVRLVLPVAPDWMLHGIGLFSMVTAVYAAAMATVQTDARRFFAYLFISHASLVLIGLEIHTHIALTAALCLWFSVVLSLGGFGLTLRALEARFGRLSIADFRGLYDSSPALAVCFMLTGLACVGFPGTVGFVCTEMLVDGAVEQSLAVGVAVVAASAFNGIAVVRAYFRLFTGARHSSTINLRIGLRERIAVLTLSVLILAGGLLPQPGVTSRHEAAVAIDHERRAYRRLADDLKAAPERQSGVTPGSP